LVGDNTAVASFDYDFNGSEGLFKDNEGTLWKLIGKAILDPAQGIRLVQSCLYRLLVFD
jgi:hypothetical protein